MTAGRKSLSGAIVRESSEVIERTTRFLQINISCSIHRISSLILVSSCKKSLRKNVMAIESGLRTHSRTDIRLCLISLDASV